MTSKFNIVSGRAGAVLRSPQWRRGAGWALGGLLLFWMLAYALVPWAAKSQIEKIASEKLGRTVTVGAVDFKPWTLEMTLSDLAVSKASAATTTDANAVEPQLSIKRIYIDAELQSLLRLAPVMDAVQVDAPTLSLTRLGDGRYDIDDILAKLQKPADQTPGEAPRFALYNVALSAGRVIFNDLPAGKAHEVRDLLVSVPFLSNLPSQRDTTTAPRLAFKLGTLGAAAASSFDSAAVGTPFAQTHKTDASFKLANFDVSPYLGYLPASLPVKLQSALLNLDAKVSFEQTPATVVKLSGVVTADKVRLQGQNGKDLLAFDQLRVAMDDVRPLEQTVKLSSIALTAPTLNVSRDRAGQLNVLLDTAKTAAPKTSAAKLTAIPDTTKTIAASNRIDSATATNSTLNGEKASPSKPWQVQVASLAVRGGRVNWLDESLASPAQVALSGLVLNASSLALPFTSAAPVQFNGAAVLDAPAGSAAATLAFGGTATDQAAQVTATVASWPLGMAAKYVGQFLLPALQGRLDAQLGVNWQAAAAGQPQALRITAPNITLGDVQLAQGRVSLVSVKQVALAGVDIDVPGQRFGAASMQLTQPKALVERDTDKRWMFERWLVANKPANANAAPLPPTTAATRASAPSWAVAVSHVAVDGGALSFADKAGTKPVAFEVSGFNAQLDALQLGDSGDKAAAASIKAGAAKLMPLSASLRLATGRFEPGKLSFKGGLGLTPVQAQGQLSVDRLPVQAFEPYFADVLNIELLRADASFKGRVAYRQTPAGPVAQVNGDAALEELKANTLAPSEDLLAWKGLSLRGLSVALDPAKATRVDVKQTVLTDFFARVIIMPDGRINLQDLVKPGSSSSTALTNSTTLTVAGTTANPASVLTATTNQGTIKTIAESNQKQWAAALKDPQKALESAPGTPTAAAPPALINFGPVSLVNGRVLFSDRFVKPNYSANLSDLTGKLSAFSSSNPTGTPDMADLELRGKAEGTASLEILGKLNPLAKPLALDITGKVRDLELPPLSPYAVKYSGYGITRGKMSVDVAYLVQPDGKLTAKNKLVLNQLSFGDKVEGATASLPVKLAVALLSDRNGVIDLDLPISGSLNDPQFSIGPIIIKVIINVIVKAITAPFSLLASAFGGGGGDELSTVAFASGSASLGPDAKAGLDKVAKALADRPSLKLTVVGTSSLQAERDGFKRARLDELVRAEKRRSVVTSGGTATAAVTVSAADYPPLLKEVYKRADITKPRNLVGMAKDLPTADMEALLLANVQVNESAMQALALQRGVAVKEYLAAKELPLDRLFLGATKAVALDATSAAPADKADAKTAAAWTPRAELNIAMP